MVTGREPFIFRFPLRGGARVERAVLVPVLVLAFGSAGTIASARPISEAARLAQLGGNAPSFQPHEEAESRRFARLPVETEPEAPPEASYPPPPEPRLEPSTHVLDKLKLFSSFQKVGLGNELLNASKREGISIMLVTLPSPPAISVNRFAQELSSSWRDSQLFALVLCVTRRPENLQRDLFIVPGDNAIALLGEIEANAAAERAKARALEAGTVPEALFRASRDMISEFRSHRDRLVPEGDIGEPSKVIAPAPARAHRSPARVGLLLLSLLLLILLFGFLYVRRLRNRPLYFPEADINFRLWSPYSGGNSARLDFRSLR